jgi:hypothetical protein
MICGVAARPEQGGPTYPRTPYEALTLTRAQELLT